METVVSQARSIWPNSFFLMDLIRSAIKSLFYDYPLDAVAGYIQSGNYRDPSDFEDRIQELMTWREQGFSASEMSLMRGIFDDEWLIDEETGFGSDNVYHPYERIFLILQNCARQLLRLRCDQPVVMFNQLLRWRELTLLVGEDNLTIPFLARQDLMKNHKRTSFLWPNILNHDDVQLNGLLKETLSDTHFHLNAGCDVFEFNWIIIMNHPEVFKSDGSSFFTQPARRDYDPIHRFSELNLPFIHWIAIAAYIRVKIIGMVLNDCSDMEESLLPDYIFSKRQLHNLQSLTSRIIEPFRKIATKTSNDLVFDYAINNKSIAEVPDSLITDVYMAHHGERFILYQYLKRYYGNNERFRRFAPCVYLYLLIKNKMRREIIQTNKLRGFHNFQIYQSYKTAFFHNADDFKAINEIAFRYAVQSAIGSDGGHNVEARVTPNSINSFQCLDYTKSIFGNTDVLNGINSRLSLICHFIKAKDIINDKLSRHLRHGVFRKRLWNELKKVKQAWERNSMPEVITKLTGIDAASDELVCRPEVFGPIFKEAKSIGIDNVTYHVGEDFYDVVDGLRAIDEAIGFLDLRSGSRLGHALALGINSEDYYTKRHRYIIIPAQIFLDNLVWMKFKAMEHNIQLSPETLLFICEKFSALIENLKYGDCNEAQYWDSMKKRGADPFKFKVDPESKSDGLLDTYWNSVETRKHGDKVITCQLPKSFVADVKRIQHSMYSEIEERGIFIETNPTSNMMIGGFERYIDLPLLKFHTPAIDGYKLPVSINTDDKGVFATSINNEYSLVAAALMKEKDASGARKWNDKQIVDYLRQIAQYGNLSRFSV